MAYRMEVERHTSGEVTTPNTFQELLKTYYNITVKELEEVKVATRSLEHFKVQASPSVSSRIINSINRPQNWTITPPPTPPPGYSNNKDHITISITYSDDLLTGTLGALPSVDFVQKLIQSGKVISKLIYCTSKLNVYLQKHYIYIIINCF